MKAGLALLLKPTREIALSAVNRLRWRENIIRLRTGGPEGYRVQPP